MNRNDQLILFLHLLNLIELWKGRLKEAKTESEYIYAEGAIDALKQLKDKINKEFSEGINK